MAYSRSPITVMRMEADLRELAAGRPCAWHRPEGDTVRWAAKVREALFAAKRHPQRFPGLARHADSFTIEVTDEHTVQARLRYGKAETPTTVVAPLEPTPVQGLEPAGSTRTIVGVKSVTDVISQWLRAQPSNDPMHFPDAKLSTQDLIQLSAWARSRSVPWGVIKPTGSSTLTLIPAGRGTDVEFWTPEQGGERDGQA